MAAADGLTITYQGKTCLPQFEFKRSAGLEPDYGWVAMHRDEFEDFRIVESIPGADFVPESLQTQEKPSPPARGFQTAGRLIVQELVPGYNNGQPYKLTFEQVLVTERAIEVAIADDTDENEVVRLPLTDIRALYNRGCLSGWFNVRVQGVLEEGTQDKSGPPFVPGSLKDGKPWTVETFFRMIVELLPGDPVITIQSPRPDFYDKQLGPHAWDAVKPKEALQEVLKEFNLVFTLNPDASVSLWDADEGGLVEAIGAKFKPFTTVDTSDPAVDERIADARKVTTFHYVPPVVVVVGAPTIVADRVLLEPCGRSRNGTVVPLAQALKGIGLDMARATKFAMLSKQERSALLGVSEDGLREFEEWAFRWFRLPGGVAQNAHRLPILDARAALGSTGELLPVRVFSESHTVAEIIPLMLHAGPTGLARQIKLQAGDLKDVEERLRHSLDLSEAERNALEGARATIKSKLDQLSQKLVEESSAAGLGVDEAAGFNLKSAEAEVQRARDAVEAAVRDHGITSDEAAQAALEVNGALDQLAAARKAIQKNESLAEKLAEKIAKTPTQKLRVVLPTGFGEATGGFKIDEHGRREGIVKFDSVQGRVVEFEPSGDLPALETAYLSEFAAVDLEFCYVRKPNLNDKLSLGCRYFSVWRRKGDGSGALVTQEDEIPPGSAPLLVGPLPALQMVETLDPKKTAANKDHLDEVSSRLAGAILHAEQSNDGAIVEFCRPVPIACTGTVLSVAWSAGGDEIPKTVAHVGCYSKLAPPPPDDGPAPDRGPGVLDDAVFLGRGLGQ